MPVIVFNLCRLIGGASAFFWVLSNLNDSYRTEPSGLFLMFLSSLGGVVVGSWVGAFLAGLLLGWRD
jgi:hypothetical protein